MLKKDQCQSIPIPDIGAWPRCELVSTRLAEVRQFDQEGIVLHEGALESKIHVELCTVEHLQLDANVEDDQCMLREVQIHVLPLAAGAGH